MRIVGLDLSLTATGVCTVDTCATFSTKRTGMERLHDIGEAIVRVLAPHTDLVVIEGYSFGSKNSQAHALGELGGVMRHGMWQRHIAYVDVPPTVLKKFATGKGNANKDQMVATAARLGCPADDNNAVDAWWLRNMGLYAYGLPQPALVTAYRSEAVSKVDWPQL